MSDVGAETYGPIALMAAGIVGVWRWALGKDKRSDELTERVVLAIERNTTTMLAQTKALEALTVAIERGSHRVPPPSARRNIPPTQSPRHRRRYGGTRPSDGDTPDKPPTA